MEMTCGPSTTQNGQFLENDYTSIMAVMLLVGLWLLFLVYLYFQSIYGHWTRKGLPQPTLVVPLAGNVSKAVLKIRSMGMIYYDIYWRYRAHDAVGFYEFLSPKLMLIKPELFKQVLVSDFSSFHDNEIHASEKMDPYLKNNSFLQRGDKWRVARNKLIQGLTTSKMRELLSLMKQCLPQLDNYIAAHDVQHLQAAEMSGLFTMTNISSSVFGIESNCFGDRDAPFRKLTDLLHKEHWHQWWQTMMVFHLPKLRDMLGYSFIPRPISIFMEAMVRQVAEARKKNNINRNDYVQAYLGRDKPHEENIMDLIYNGMVFFIAGTETSALVSTNTLYALAMNPLVQERLYQELRNAHSVSPAMDYDTLVGLPYLDKVLHESLRKYPILYAVMRVCTQTAVLEIDGKDVKIEAGTKVMIPTLAVHHDPEYYPDPDVFDPERFSEECKASRPEYTYLPWGEGPRICAGKKFALCQVKLYIAHIVHKYRILPTEGTPSKLTYNDFGIFVTPSEPILIHLEKRV